MSNNEDDFGVKKIEHKSVLFQRQDTNDYECDDTLIVCQKWESFIFCLA